LFVFLNAAFMDVDADIDFYDQQAILNIGSVMFKR
jgi:hypothetical protein